MKKQFNAVFHEGGMEVGNLNIPAENVYEAQGLALQAVKALADLGIMDHDTKVSMRHLGRNFTVPNDRIS